MYLAVSIPSPPFNSIPKKEQLYHLAVRHEERSLFTPATEQTTAEGRTQQQDRKMSPMRHVSGHGIYEVSVGAFQGASQHRIERQRVRTLAVKDFPSIKVLSTWSSHHQPPIISSRCFQTECQPYLLPHLKSNQCSSHGRPAGGKGRSDSEQQEHFSAPKRSPMHVAMLERPNRVVMSSLLEE